MVTTAGMIDEAVASTAAIRAAGSVRLAAGSFPTCAWSHRRSLHRQPARLEPCRPGARSQPERAARHPGWVPVPPAMPRCGPAAATSARPRLRHDPKVGTRRRLPIHPRPPPRWQAAGRIRHPPHRSRRRTPIAGFPCRSHRPAWRVARQLPRSSFACSVDQLLGPRHRCPGRSDHLEDLGEIIALRRRRNICRLKPRGGSRRRPTPPRR